MMKSKIAASLIIFLIVTTTAFAQPQLSKQNMPGNISAEIKTKIESLYSADPAARATAAYELGELTPDSNPAIPFLVKMLGDDVPIDPLPYHEPNWWSSQYEVILKTSPGREAAKALVIIGDPAVEPLIAALKDADWKIRQGAVRIFGEIEDYRALKTVITTLKDKNWQVRAEAAKTLSRFEDFQSVPALVAALKDAQWQVRKESVHALGHIKDPY